MEIKLGFNIDHIATLRNARLENYPDLIRAAHIAIEAGANQITAHLREDRRHIKDQDVYALKDNIAVDLNLEMAATDEMVAIACKVKPYSVCLVPERRNEVTTEGGLDIYHLAQTLLPKIEHLNNNGIQVSLFLDAEERQIHKALELPINSIEINTGKYANIHNHLETLLYQGGKETATASQLNEELQKIIFATNLIRSNGIKAHAGHGLNYSNIANIAKIKSITEFNIGHFLVSEALFLGLSTSIAKMLELIINER